MSKFRTIIFMVVVYVFFIHSFAMYHELSHQAIFKYYGCDSEIFMSPLVYQTIPEPGCVITPEMRELHAWNEIIGYHLTPVFTAGLFFFFVYYVTWKTFQERASSTKEKRRRKPRQKAARMEIAN